MSNYKNKTPKRAIILATGFGMRMVPINTEMPKGLLEVNGEPLIERIIKQLHEVGIQEIYVIVGFMKEKYEYLMDEYGVDLVDQPGLRCKEQSTFPQTGKRAFGECVHRPLRHLV